MPTIFEVLKGLPVSKRADLARTLWNSVLEKSDNLPLPESHRAELQTRLQNPSPKLIPWKEVNTRFNL
jgi:putative addiction module component (TIGR02574 family)